MCGIAGILGEHVSESLLTDMCDAIAHRGPDGVGIWISENKTVGFGHRRLAILDLSAEANQPMGTLEGRLQIVYNGEIYNHQALRLELQSLGASFRTHHSDTEVLLQGYLIWGIRGLLDKLQGMFAFALYDKANQKLWLARDRIGVKPLYFTWVNKQFIFASEIKALLANKTVPREVDTQALHHYLSFRFAPAPLTLFKDIFKLSAGHVMQVTLDGKSEIHQWWDTVPGKGINPASLIDLSHSEKESFYIEGIRSRLEKAVVKRMISDVPVGVFLSGGIDSTTILALMSKNSSEPIHSFSVGYQDHLSYNELEFARLASRQYGSLHHEILIQDKEVINFIETLAYHQDEPIADWVCIPLHFVSRLAKEVGIKVVQLGEGADEQFCGYSYYLKILWFYKRYWKNFQRLPKKVQIMIKWWTLGLSKMHPKLFPLVDMMTRATHQGEIFWTGAPVFWENEKSKLLSTASLNNSADIIRETLAPFDVQYPNQEQLTRMIYTEFKLRLPELLLMRVDKMTMANSLEARVPFLDPELINFTMDIPEFYKINGQKTKQILKSAVRGLIPDSIIDRPKQGFGTPMVQWLKGPIGRYIEDKLFKSDMIQQGLFNEAYIKKLISHHQKGYQDRSVQIWNLFNLISWYDHWIAK